MEQGGGGVVGKVLCWRGDESGPGCALTGGMDVKFWGVRGSIATSGPEFAKFGGNTTCVEVVVGGQRIILDAGTGIRGLGAEMVKRPRIGRTAMFWSHLHWDHIQGFPFFMPAFKKGA